MKTKYLQITEVLETRNNKCVIYITQIQPKGMIYYDEQKSPHLSYHWMTAENWALYYRNMRGIVKNFLSGCISTEEDTFYLDSKQTVFVNVKVSQKSLESIIPSVVGMDIADLKVAGVFETMIKDVSDRNRSPVDKDMNKNDETVYIPDPLEETMLFLPRQTRHQKKNENISNLVNPTLQVEVSSEKIRRPTQKFRQSTLNVAATRSKMKAQKTPERSQRIPSNREIGRDNVKLEDDVVEISESNSSSEKKCTPKQINKKIKKIDQLSLSPLSLWSKNDKIKSQTKENNEKSQDKSETSNPVTLTNTNTNNVASPTLNLTYLDAYIGKSELKNEKNGLIEETGIINETKNRSEELSKEKDGCVKTRRCARSPVKPKRNAEDKQQLKRAWCSPPKSIEEHPPVASQMTSSNAVNPKPVIKADNHKECKESKLSESLLSLLPVCKAKPLEKVEFISLKDLKPNEILDSFEKYKYLFDNLFMKYRNIPQIKGHNGIDHYKVIDLIDNDVQLLLMKKLSERYENRERSSSKYAKLFAHVMMPEWLLSLYMERLDMNREDALKRLDAQNLYQAQTTELPFESSLAEDCDFDY